MKYKHWARLESTWDFKSHKKAIEAWQIMTHILDTLKIFDKANVRVYGEFAEFNLKDKGLTKHDKGCKGYKCQ